MKMPSEAIDITINVLNGVASLHYKSCLEDVSCRPDFNCQCPIKSIVEKLLKMRQVG